MFVKSAIRYGSPLGATVAAFSSQSQIKNEGRRRFYEDESNVVPVPGTVTPAPGTEIEILGPNRLVDGVSVRSTSSIESFFRRARESTVESYVHLQNYLNKGYTKYNNTERQVTGTLSELHHKSEDLFPNAIYVVIATLSGNIMARQRTFVAKAVFPVTLGIVSFKYFLPETFRNVSGFVWRLEQQNVPKFAEKQEIALSKADRFVQCVEEKSQNSKKRIEGGAQSLRKSIADITGLNLDEEVSKK